MQSRSPMIRAAAALLSAGFMAAIILLAQAPHSPAADAGTLLEEGTSLYGSGRFREAAERFEAVLETDPDSTQARRNLAASLGMLSQQLMVEGNWNEARELAERAAAADEGNPDPRFLLAMIIFRQGDLYYARYAAKEALELDPDHPGARELLGDILYREGYIDLAIPEWERALAGSPRKNELREKISRGAGELRVEQGFKRDVSSHFTLTFDGPVPWEVGQEVLEQLEVAHERLRDSLGDAPPDDITVILYSREAFHIVTRSPRWVGGRYDGKVRIPVGGITSRSDAARMAPILAHELTHAFLRALVPQGLPLWFEEGLAEHFEGTTADAARGWFRAHAETGFAGLDEVSRALREPGNRVVEAAYLAALLAVETLIEEEGSWTIRDVLRSMAGGRSFAAALEQEARLTGQELEQLWLRAFP